MAKCPNCAAEIEHLNNCSEEEGLYRFTVSKRAGVLYPNYERIDTIPSGNSDYFECPECYEVLFINIDDAINFFVGEPDKLADEHASHETYRPDLHKDRPLCYASSGVRPVGRRASTAGVTHEAPAVQATQL